VQSIIGVIAMLTKQDAVRGQFRMRQIAAEDSARADNLTRVLLASLQREPLPSEEIAAALIGRTFARMDRLARSGKKDANERRLLTRLLTQTPFGMQPSTRVNILAPRAPGEPRPEYHLAEKSYRISDTAPAGAAIGDEPAGVVSDTTPAPSATTEQQHRE
jgi:hypothetical protein